ncbi:unnamed protein product, partial [Amoebophrya sp. A25]
KNDQEHFQYKLDYGDDIAESVNGVEVTPAAAEKRPLGFLRKITTRDKGATPRNAAMSANYRTSSAYMQIT